jgi:hypothetical protein
MTIKWVLKQLLPFTYHSVFVDEKGQKWFCIWNMWLGKCFNIENIKICT